jgi:hypothetical protein
MMTATDAGSAAKPLLSVNSVKLEISGILER